MTTMWTAIVLVALATALLKAAGPAVVGDRALPPRLAGTAALAAPALLSGLLVVEVAGHGWSSDSWAVVAGLAAAGLAALLRAPMLVAVLVAMAVTALARLWVF